MNLQNYYWYFVNALPHSICDQIIKHAGNKKPEVGIVGDLSKKVKEGKKLTKKDKEELYKVRKSNVVWLDDRWIYNEIHPYINHANKNAGWNFQWDWSESCQFTVYKKNQFYDWHCDSWDSIYNKPEDLNRHNKIRKLSVTVSLSDPKEYSGGLLQFDFRNSKEGKPVIRDAIEILPKGSICVFPSFVWHRVTPVTKGTRKSLVIWNLGYPFK